MDTVLVLVVTSTFLFSFGPNLVQIVGLTKHILIVSISTLLIDRLVLKNDEAAGATFMTTTGLPVSTAGILGSS